MRGILDSISAKAKSFHPESVSEYSALQLAKKLDDTESLWKYLALLNQHAPSVIVEAFIRAQGRGLTEKELISAFDEELARLATKEGSYEY